MSGRAQFIKYSAVAVATAGTDWLVFLLLRGALGGLYAQLIARVAGGLFAFLMNRLWSFRAAGGSLTKQGRRFLMLYAFSYCLSGVLFYAGANVFGFSDYWVKLFTDASCMLINFIVCKKYVYAE